MQDKAGCFKDRLPRPGFWAPSSLDEGTQRVQLGVSLTKPTLLLGLTLTLNMEANLDTLAFLTRHLLEGCWGLQGPGR